jgi:HEAT repeat protein
MQGVQAVLGAELCLALRQAIVAKLDDPGYDVPQAAIEALAGLVGTDAALRQAIIAKLDDPDNDVRRAAIGALAGLVGTDAALAPRLLPCLGTVVESYEAWTRERIRRLLAETFAPLLVHDQALLAQVVGMLGAPAWQARQGAAWTLLAMPGGPPAHRLPTLYGLLQDTRGEEGWPARLTVSALLLNDRDTTLSQHAIAVAVAALDYATQPWYNLLQKGARVRQQAAQILGQLEPLYRNEAIFARLARVLHEDTNPAVRDAAYGALLRLAAAPEAE